MQQNNDWENKENPAWEQLAGLESQLHERDAEITKVCMNKDGSDTMGVWMMVKAQGIATVKREIRRSSEHTG